MNTVMSNLTEAKADYMKYHFERYGYETDVSMLDADEGGYEFSITTTAPPAVIAKTSEYFDKLEAYMADYTHETI